MMMTQRGYGRPCDNGSLYAYVFGTLFLSLLSHSLFIYSMVGLYHPSILYMIFISFVAVPKGSTHGRRGYDVILHG